MYSELDVGTTVKLYLPRAQGAPEDIVRREQRPAIGGSETILVAEDDEQVRSTVVDTLKELGYQVLMASDAEGALAILQSGIKVDLLFTDVVMPGALKSPELAIKARDWQPGIAVLFTSGYTRNAIVHGGRLDEGVQLLSKPYSREELASCIRQTLAKQAQHLSGSRSSKGSRPASSKPPARIVLVGADALEQATTSEVLNALGHRVTFASTAASIQSELDAGHVDVLVVDADMRGGEGRTLAMQALRQGQGLKVILLGEAVDKSTVPGALPLRSPFDTTTLAATLASLGIA